MVTTLSSMLAVLSSAGIVGLGDQYLALFVLGLLARIGWVDPVGTAAFVSQDWFLLVCAIAWGMTVLPSALPNSPIPTLVNAVSGPISVVSGAVFAWASAGIIASVRPEFAASMYLLSRDAHWTNFQAYQPADVAVLAGGAAIASSLTFVKFLAKPGIAAETGTIGMVAAPMFAAAESAASILLVPSMVLLAKTDPALVALFMGLAIGAMLVLLVLSIRWLIRAKRGAGRAFQLLSDEPRKGLSVVGEFVLPGSGWIVQGYIARGSVMLAIWAGLVALALTVVGLILAIPAYLTVARWSAGSLYKEIVEKEQFPPGWRSLPEPVGAFAHQGHDDAGAGPR